MSNVKIFPFWQTLQLPSSELMSWGGGVPKTLTLKMITAVFAETLINLQYLMQLIPER
jgi:hypothetical protein